MKRLATSLLILFLILLLIHFAISVLVSRSVETAIRIWADEAGREVSYSTITTSPYQAAVTINDVSYAGPGAAAGAGYPARITARSVQLRLGHADFFRVVFAPSEATFEQIGFYEVFARDFTYQHHGYDMLLTAQRLEWSQEGNLSDFADALFNGSLPAGAHRFRTVLTGPGLRYGTIASLPGFRTEEELMISDLLVVDLGFNPETRDLSITEFFIEDGRNRAEIQGNARFQTDPENGRPLRINLELHLESASPDFNLPLPGNPASLVSQYLKATLLSVITTRSGTIETDDLVISFLATGSVLRPSGRVEQQLQPMFRMMGIPLQPLGVSSLEGEVMLLGNRFEAQITEAKTAYTGFRFNMVSLLDDELGWASPVTGGSFELYDMQPSVVQLVRGLEAFMRWRLIWDGNQVFVPVRGTLANPQLIGITTR
jgi:hypothetical protein